MTENTNANLTVSVEPMEGLARRMTVTIPASRLNKAIDLKLTGLMKKAKINGFRPGKAPKKVVEREYGDGVRVEVINDIIYKTVPEALDEAKVEPAANPVIDNVDTQPGADLVYTVVFDVFPEVILKDFSELSVVRETAALTDENLNKAIERIREQSATWETTEQAAKMGDKVILGCEGYMDGEPFEGGTIEEHELRLGSGNFIPGFEEGLVGVTTDQDVSLDLTFPEEYHAKELAGQPVTFKVKVHEVLEKCLPELDEAFLEKFELDENNVDNFKKKVSENMQRELDQRLKTNLKKALFDSLFELHKDLELPKSLVDRSLERKQSEFMAQFEQYAGKNRSLPPIDKELFRDEVTRDVHLSLLFTHIIDKFDVKADDEKVNKKIEEQADLYADPEAYVAKVKHSPKEREQFAALVLEEAVVDLMLEKAKIEDKTVSYDDVMNPKTEDKKKEDTI